MLIYSMFAEIALISIPAGENSSSGPFKAGQSSAGASLIMSM